MEHTYWGNVCFYIWLKYMYCFNGTRYTTQKFHLKTLKHQCMKEPQQQMLAFLMLHIIM